MTLTSAYLGRSAAYSGANGCGKIAQDWGQVFHYHILTRDGCKENEVRHSCDSVKPLTPQEMVG